MKFWNMIVDIISKVPLKFGGTEKLCVSEVQKATQIVTWPIHVKLGFMHKLTGMYTQNTLSLDDETLENDGTN